MVPTTLQPGDVLVADPTAFGGTGGIIQVDPATGAQTVVSQGGYFQEPHRLAIAANGDLFVVDPDAFGGTGGIIRVDPMTGTQTPVTQGGYFVRPVGIAIAANADLFVTDLNAFGGNGGVIRVDPTTGIQTVLSTGGHFYNPSGIAVAANGDLYVADNHFFDGDKVIRIDPISGAQTVVSSFSSNDGIIGLASAANRDLYVSGSILGGGAAGIVRVNPATGAQTVVAQGGNFTGPRSLAIAVNGDLLAADPDAFGGSGGILRVDPTTGIQIAVSQTGYFVDPYGIAIVPGVVECVPAPPGLVAWWSGEGDASDRTGQHNGIVMNGVTFAPGRVGQAPRFDGIDDFIRIPHDPALNPRDGLTIEAWIKSESTAGSHVIASKWNDDTADWSYIFKDWNSTDTISIELSRSIHSDLAGLVGTTSIPLGTWVHVAATFDGNNVRLYFNGILDASLNLGTNQVIDTSTTDFLIGAGFTGGAVRENFAGLIDELAVYNRALSLAEIDSIYRAGSAGKCLNQAPTASVGGPYAVTYADSLTLDATGSSDPDGDALTYSWTINGHAAAAAGVQPALSFSALEALGITSGTTYPVSVTVDDGHGHVVTSTVVPLTVTPATPTISLVTPPALVTGTATAALSGTIRAGALVPPGDVTITIDGVSRNAAIDASGNFSVAFPTAALQPGAYSIDYVYPGSTNFADTDATATLTVTYGIGPRFNQTVPRKAGSTIPIQLALLDAAGRNVSSPAVRIRALGIAPLSNPDNLLPAEDAGNSNPGNFFRLQGGANPFYQFNLKTPKALVSGVYLLYFEVEGDPIRHSVSFTIA